MTSDPPTFCRHSLCNGFIENNFAGTNAAGVAAYVAEKQRLLPI